VQILLGVLVLAAVLAAFWRLAAGRRGRGGHRFKCHNCQHLRKGFDDGVMCGYGTREVFKTPAHIRMCGDWAPANDRR
jgi:hypothetical protein